jgi:hypothetical protein
MRFLSGDPERQSVENFLAVVIRDAQFMANMTAAFLENHDIRPGKKQVKSAVYPTKGSMTLENPMEDTRANAFLCNLGAALRIASWERTGLQPVLPADLPSSSEAFRNIVPPEMCGITEDVPDASEPYQKVLRIWLQQFSRSSHFSLGTDVYLSINTVEEDKLLDAVADLLWQNRHL